MKLLKSHKCFEGYTRFWEHESVSTKTMMKFSTYEPPGKIQGALIWLSGLTCTDENFITKAGAQRYLAESGLVVICPDTSPRGLDLPGEHESYDFGSGAGFYVDATTEGYKDHYRMYSYIADELYSLVQSKFEVEDRISIFGHSMGGHGALVIGLREPQKFRSISAFAPIANPAKCPWGKKAFSGYLGDNPTSWLRFDATELIRAGASHPSQILIDQGRDDEFLEPQLYPENLLAAAKEQGQNVDLRYRDGYDHSYYFISSFVGEHIRFHHKYLIR